MFALNRSDWTDMPMRARALRPTRKRPATLWILKLVDGFGITLMWISLLAVVGSIAMELYSILMRK